MLIPEEMKEKDLARMLKARYHKEIIIFLGTNSQTTQAKSTHLYPGHP
jgi:hypothetical protein